MKISRIFAAMAALALSVSCGTKVVDTEYPGQKLYLPAATRDAVYVIESVDTHVAQTPTPGSTFRFTIDWAKGEFIVPMGVYRAGVNNNGEAVALISDAAELIQPMIDNGTLPKDTEVLSDAFFTLPSEARIADGSSSVIFNIVCDLDYLMSNAPVHKYAIALKIGSNTTAVNESLGRIVVLIDTKVFDDPNLPLE